MRLTLRRSLLLVAVLAWAFGGHLSRELGAASRQGAAQPVEFNRDVRPILSDACFSCHGPNESTRQAALRLDVQEGVFEDRGRPTAPSESSTGRPPAFICPGAWRAVGICDTELRKGPS